MKKLTNVLALEMVLGMAEVQANTELVAKLETMKAQFEKKNSSKPSDEEIGARRAAKNKLKQKFKK